MRMMITAVPAGLAGLALAALVPAAPALAATPLPCHVSMSNSRPADYTTTVVQVLTGGKAKVTTVAHYKTTNHAKTAVAGPLGHANVPYYISGATPGFKVTVTVTATAAGRAAGHCSTSFIPHR